MVICYKQTRRQNQKVHSIEMKSPFLAIVLLCISRKEKQVDLLVALSISLLSRIPPSSSNRNVIFDVCDFRDHCAVGRISFIIVRIVMVWLFFSLNFFSRFLSWSFCLRPIGSPLFFIAPLHKRRHDGEFGRTIVVLGTIVFFVSF